jgi:hypothetical protein
MTPLQNYLDRIPCRFFIFSDAANSAARSSSHTNNNSTIWKLELFAAVLDHLCLYMMAWQRFCSLAFFLIAYDILLVLLLL